MFCVVQLLKSSDVVDTCHLFCPDRWCSDEIGHPVDDQTLSDMIIDADADGSGVVDENEFIEMMARQMAGSESESESDTDAEENTSDDDLDLSPTGGIFDNPLASSRQPGALGAFDANVAPGMGRLE